MRTTDTHVYFWNGIYSNWHPAPFVDTLNGIRFANSEQAFMWWKAHRFGDIETRNEIEKTPDPKEVKKLGRKVKGFDVEKWDNCCFNIMVYVIDDKFRQNPEMLKELLATGNKTIVEASPYDIIWGVGLLEDDDLILDEKNWRGKNLLGKALMEVRERLRKYE